MSQTSNPKDFNVTEEQIKKIQEVEDRAEVKILSSKLSEVIYYSKQTIKEIKELKKSIEDLEGSFKTQFKILR